MIKNRAVQLGANAEELNKYNLLILKDIVYLSKRESVLNTNTVNNNIDLNSIVSYKISGNSSQTGTPSTNNIVEVESVGNKTINLFKLPKESSANVILLENGLESLKQGRCVINIDKLELEIGKKYTCKVDTENVTGVGSSGVMRLADGTNSTIIYNSNLDVVIFEVTEAFVNYNQVWIYGVNTQYLNIMIVEGEYTAATFPEFEEYGKNKLPITVEDSKGITADNILLEEPLRKIGEYSDYLDFKTGKVVRQIKEYSFTGKEDWIAAGNTFSVTLNDLKPGTEMLSNTYLGIKASVDYTNMELNQIKGDDNNGTIYVSTGLSSVSEFKSYLTTRFEQNNPVKLLYVMNSETTERVDLPQINVNKGKVTVSIGTEGIPSEFTVDYLYQ